ncbi:MAG: hydrogenase 4 subunit F [Sulfolobaceae archaeon]
MIKTLSEYLIILIPILVNIGIFHTLKTVKALSIISSVIILVLSILLYFKSPIENGTFFITKFTALLLTMISSIYLLSVLYSLDYIKSLKGIIKEKTYYVLLNLFVATMIFSIIINNYGLMWVGVELTTVTSALLITTEFSETSLESTWRYIIVVSAGVTIALFSVILIYSQYHTLTITQILSQKTDNLVIRAAVGLALIGFGTKVGVFPMYTWLPDAHSEAPSPVSALFSGVLLPVALYVLYRIYEIDPLTNLFIAFSLISIATASIILMYQWHIKRMFAYSTIENMNIALLGLAIGQPIGALILLISHAFGKAAAFYSSGVVIESLNEKKIENISGLHNKLKITSSSLLLSSLAVTGTPPFGTFIGEFLILQSLVKEGYLTEFIILVLLLAMAFISINYHVSKMIFTKDENKENNHKEPKLLSTISLISSLISLGIGIFLIILGVIQ